MDSMRKPWDSVTPTTVQLSVGMHMHRVCQMIFDSVRQQTFAACEANAQTADIQRHPASARTEATGSTR